MHSLILQNGHMSLISIADITNILMSRYIYIYIHTPFNKNAEDSQMTILLSDGSCSCDTSGQPLHQGDRKHKIILD